MATTEITINKQINLEQLVIEIRAVESGVPIEYIGNLLRLKKTGITLAQLQAIVDAHDHTVKTANQLNEAQLETVKTARDNLQSFIDADNGTLTLLQVVAVVKLLCRYVLYVTRN